MCIFPRPKIFMVEMKLASVRVVSRTKSMSSRQLTQPANKLFNHIFCVFLEAVMYVRRRELLDPTIGTSYTFPLFLQHKKK